MGKQMVGFATEPPNRRVFGVSNRGDNTVSFFHFDPNDGRVEAWCDVPSGGSKPRDFEFSRCGRWLLITNQDSDLVSVTSIETISERRLDGAFRINVCSPSCIRQL